MANQEANFLQVLQWNEDECREYLEAMRWPEGPYCPKCGAPEPYKITRKSQTKNAVRSLYRCRSCKRQFTATVGTIFEDSHIPLNKWFAAIYLMCSSKKGMSAHQMHRQLGVTYKSAWFMCHRVREAMKDNGAAPRLQGIIEADETYIGGKRHGHPTWKQRETDEINMGMRPKRSDWRTEKAAVFGMLERGGKVRAMHVKQADGPTLRPILIQNIDVKQSRLITDAHPAYRPIRKYLPHDVIRHEIEYVNGDVYIQGIENYWSLLKRGVYGVFHHVSEGYLSCYLSEFQYRFNRRMVSDAERFSALMGRTQGRVLWYCRTPQPENPYA